MKKLLPFCVFLVAGLVSSVVTFQSLMWAVWGAPTSWNQYVALLGSFALCVSAFACFWTVTRAYWMARGSLVAMGCFYIPGVVSLVPAHNTITSPVAFVVVLVYFVALGFAFLTPRLERWTAAVFVLVICASIALYASTYLDRVKSGEYAWPLFDFYMVEGSEPISVGRDHMQVLTDSDVEQLRSIGLRGELNWFGRSGKDGGASVIVICRDRVSEPRQIRFPKTGRAFFIFDGVRWTTVPASFDSYDRFVTLQRDGMLSQELSSGGIQSSRVYMNW